MKKTEKKQKRIGNKGFSLVELIVVIAIMAVLVGVLAPTLIRNIEKSRESKDMATLDKVYTAIQTAMADEKANDAAPAAGSYIELTAANLATANAFYDQVKQTLGSATLPTFVSENGKKATSKIYFKFDATTEKVTVMLSTDGTEANVVTAPKSSSTFKIN